jgi:TonB family protein
MKLRMDLPLMSVLAFLALSAMSAPKDQSPSGDTLISQARSLEVWAEGTPAVRMRGQIEVSGTNQVAQGDYAVNWVSPSQWREEIRFPNYQRTRIRDARGYWQNASLDYQPYLIYLLTDLLDLKTVLSVSPKETLGKVKTRQKDGVQQKCVDLNMTNETNRVFCFDDKSGALVAIDYAQHEHGNPPELSRIEYKDFRSVAGKLIPYDRRALRNGKTIASVKVSEVNELNPVNAAEFTPPPSAELWPQCDGMQEADITGRIAPNYPEAARHNREMGRVILYGVVETDGTSSHLLVIKGATPALNEAALESFRRSHYTPAQCQSKPIRLERFFETDFRLQQ